MCERLLLRGKFASSGRPVPRASSYLEIIINVSNNELGRVILRIEFGFPLGRKDGGDPKMTRNRYNIRLFLILVLAFLFLNGCVPLSGTFKPTDSIIELTFTPTFVGKEETLLAYPVVTPDLASPYPVPSTPGRYLSPTPSITPTIRYSPTITPTFTATATLPPYTGKPFTIVYPRDGNLWLSEIGGRDEHQLTHEPEGWSVFRFDINRRGDRIAYITWKFDHELADAMIKQLDLRTGEISPLVGMGDGLIEYRLRWLDDTHLAYTYQEFSNYHIATPAAPTPAGGYHPYNYFVFDLTSGKSTYIPQAVDISQSPDGRYLLTCSSYYFYEPSCKFSLSDLVVNQTLPVAEDSFYGWFEGWSADSKWMLFANAPYGNTQTDHKYLIVDPASRLGKWVDLPGHFCNSISWASHSDVIACSICESETGCQIRFWGPDGIQTKPPIPLPQPFYIVSWTPDDTRIVLFPEDHTIWIINIDGTGLRQIFGNTPDLVVLPQSGD
jgi:hypothetical protein